ncbi:aldo/keto reductase [Cellulosilyticum sp. I15G10I2]|uniref:aldo/keto reductase n=1 Tax=Cellulosilyticum sp. I15G10I2 TaxID=1892843 RepID=UPI00085BCE5F|nr:aldo/keto reductase [Cellulosilyticum sp. I15G10I2]
MIYRQYGQTDKEVSIIGFGGMRFLEEDFQEGNYEKCAELINYAREKGINYFDTAPLYCDDQSEKILGYAFSQMKKDFFVATKTSTHVTGDKTSDDVLRRIETSLSRLKIDKINFMHLWCVLDYDMFERYTQKGGLFEGFLKAKARGLVEHIALSTHASGEDIEKMLETELFEGVLLGYNATNFAFREKGLEAAKRLKRAVVTMNPLGGGLIPQRADYYAFLKQNAEDTVAKAAIRFNASHPEITVTLCGFSNKEQVDEACEAIKDLKPITDAEKLQIKSHLKASLNNVCTGCGYCDDCPKGIAIPKLMDAYNQYIITDKEEDILRRIKNHWQIKAEKGGALQCTACGKCERACTQKLPIIERLREISAL